MVISLFPWTERRVADIELPASPSPFGAIHAAESKNKPNGLYYTYPV